MGVPAFAPSAQAAGACSSSRNGHDGYYYDPNVHPGYTFEGASTYIVVRQGTNCSGVTGDGNFNNAYVMLAANPHASAYNTGWAQVGFELTNPHTLRWFSQDYSGQAQNILETKYSTFSITSTIGVRHGFRSFYLLTCGCMVMQIDSTVWASSSFSPYNGWLTPFSPQYETEAGYYEADIPGTSTAPTAYTGMGVYDHAGSNVLVPCVLSLDDPNPRWKNRALSCNAVNYWTG